LSLQKLKEVWPPDNIEEYKEYHTPTEILTILVFVALVGNEYRFRAEWAAKYADIILLAGFVGLIGIVVVALMIEIERLWSIAMRNAIVFMIGLLVLSMYQSGFSSDAPRFVEHISTLLIAILAAIIVHLSIIIPAGFLRESVDELGDKYDEWRWKRRFSN
jgi:lysylphosphatidylglycerol synthetase-like protein (DUF2156 family)